MNLIKVRENGWVSANELHDKLYPKYAGDRPHTRKWFIRNTKDFYKDGEDYYIEQTVETKFKKVTYTYMVTIDTAKELCMLSKTRIGRIIRQYFIHCEKQLRILDAKKLEQLQEVTFEHIDRAKNGSTSIDDVIRGVKQLNQQLRILDEHRINDTLCISDICARFVDAKPWEVTYQLISDGYLVKRAMGTFPDPNYEYNNSIISVCDRYGNYYPRYTVRGVQLVEDYLREKGYQQK